MQFGIVIAQVTKPSSVGRTSSGPFLLVQVEKFANFDSNKMCVIRTLCLLMK